MSTFPQLLYVTRIVWLTGSGCCVCGCAFEGVMDGLFLRQGRLWMIGGYVE